MFVCEKEGTWKKKPFFAFFWRFSWFRALVLYGTRKTLRKVLREQLQGARKLAKGTKGSILDFSCDKRAVLVPEK